MTSRQRLLNALAGRPVDRMPQIDLGFWKETIDAWHDQGLPETVNLGNATAYFGSDPIWSGYLSVDATDGSGEVQRGMVVPEGLRVGLAPGFEVRVVADHGDSESIRLADGIVVRKSKRMSSIPTHEQHLLVDRQSWEEHYKWRLDPATPSRYPSDWTAWDRLAQNPDREEFLILPGGSLYGWLRNWMGVEGISYLVHDDPELFGEMVRTAADCICGVLETALRRGGMFDGCMIWEDMCFNKGPLISPAHVREFILPHYRRIVGVLRRHGVPHVMVDSDGSMDLTLPLWLEAGIDAFLPFEIGTTGADPVEYRRRFGPGVRLIGGFDKRIMAAGRRAIEAEVDRLAPMVAEGGFLPCCDHKVPPDVALENYRYYLEYSRRRWNPR